MFPLLFVYADHLISLQVISHNFHIKIPSQGWSYDIWPNPRDAYISDTRNCVGAGVESQRGAHVFSRNDEEVLPKKDAFAQDSPREFCALDAPDIYPSWMANYPGLFSRHPIRRRKLESVYQTRFYRRITTSLLSATGRRMQNAYAQGSREFWYECAKVTVARAIRREKKVLIE